MADPRTIRLAGSGESTQSYELAPGLAQYVQAVYVELDNSAGSDTRPVLTLSEQSGVVIAKKRQGEAIPAGDTGSATWALRLTDEAAPATAGGMTVLYDYTLPGTQRAIDTGVDGPMAGPLSPDFTELYFSAILARNDTVAGIGPNAQILVNNDTTAANYTYTEAEWLASPGGAWSAGAVDSNIFTFRIPSVVSGGGYWGGVHGTFQGYAEATSRFRQAQFWSGATVVVSAAAGGFLDFVYGVWKSSAVIDRLAVRDSGGTKVLAADSRFTVWGR